MKYFIISIVLLFLVLFVIFYPFKVLAYNEDNNFYINISNIVNLKINLFALLDNANNQDLKKQTKGFNVIKKLKFKEIDIKIAGLNFDYRLNGGYFGLLYAIFGFLDSILVSNDIKFNYDLKYQGDKSLEFKSIFRARIGNIIKGFI